VFAATQGEISMNLRGVPCYWLGTSVHFLLLLSLPAGIAWGEDPKASKGAPKGEESRLNSRANDRKNAVAGTRHWFRLVNVTFPADSTLRNDASVNKPPCLYVVLKKNGAQVGECSTYDSKGWSVDFTEDEQRLVNVWPVWKGTKDRYTIEVWDLHSWTRSHHMIFNVTGLSGEDFDSKVYERAGKLIDKERLATIEFQEVETPDKYHEPSK
jgi:hypothetical protein